MNKTFSALAFAGLALPTQAQTAGRAGNTHHRGARNRGGQLGHGSSQIRVDAAGNAHQYQRQGQPDRLRSKPLDWHNQPMTPNPVSMYLMALFNTKDGPIVSEVPAATADNSLNANFCDVWQIPLEDAGLHCVDQGAGVKFLILPPGSTDPVPEGYTPLRPAAFGNYALLPSDLKTHGDADVAASVTYAKQIKVYLLSQADYPPPPAFTDAAHGIFDSTIR